MKKLVIFFGSLVILFVAFLIWWTSNLSPVDTANTTPVSFSVSQGAGLHEIANNLQTNGLIKNPLVFLVFMKLSGLDSKVQKGDFRLSPSLSVSEIAQILIHGSEDVRITIPEGWRAGEIADFLQGNMTNFTPDWKSQLQLHEGYLFPDTYDFAKDASVNQIITTMTDNFNQKWQIAAAQQTNQLTQTQAVILASIVQRETVSPQDMRLVASALENRLAINMPLGSDVTLEYALGYQPSTHSWWKSGLTVDDLALQTPYNTRLNAGLPPTPISNPGLVALEAVLNPAKTNYLYYISDAKGVMHYATTLQEHNANIQKYGL